MTPKRYLAFGALTVAIQTGVIASQPAITMLQSAQASSANQASNAPSANRVTLNLTAATSTTSSNVSIEPTQTDAKIATVNNTVRKVSTAESVDKTVIEAVEKPKAEQRIDSQLAKKPSIEKTTTQSHPDTTPSGTNALAHKRPEHVEQELELKTAQEPTDLITNTAELNAKTPQNVAGAASDNAPVNDSLQTNIVELAKPLFATAPPQPTYPRIARKKGLEGTATIEVMFNELGEQLALTLVKSSGFSLLDQAAIAAVENWQFAAPTPRLASHYKVRVPIRFALN
ncbi:energy transducer TonB [Shewanella baltica]|uniref:energy transducer TonB n=1 Tax=Shewanella baltica TaxID=62322 RepID=UPI00217DB75C|nr:energy transducer TonB [Shewanella baltica]MCS6152071.1 energy transducer TonB [Shewanella baltica]